MKISQWSNSYVPSYFSLDDILASHERVTVTALEDIRYTMLRECSFD